MNRHSSTAAKMRHLAGKKVSCSFKTFLHFLNFVEKRRGFYKCNDAKRASKPELIHSIVWRLRMAA